ncbi:MAG TPA: tetratricopeptide repeat protein [Verrucomicrobiae bacterium]|nr:tetratricopeptide repeat protein [Verrucomicrobiae bacterium]
MKSLVLGFILISVLSADHLTLRDQMSTDDRIAAAQQAIAASPDSLPALDDLASAYLQKMRETTDFSYLERADKLVAKALASDPKNLESLVLQNQIELNRHHFRKVVDNTRALVADHPRDPRLWGMMADSLMEIGDYDAAEPALASMLDLQPGISSYNRVSWFRFLTGDAPGAIQAMKLAVRASGVIPENLAWCLVDLGNLYFKTSDLDYAQASYTAALQLFPSSHAAFAGLGRVAAARHDTAAAIANYKRAQSIVPMPEYAHELRQLYVKEGKTADSKQEEALLDVIDRLARANFENTDRNLAIVYADEGRHLDRALELAHNELDFRRDVYTYDALAWVEFRAGHCAEAKEAIAKALSWHTPDPLFSQHAAAIATCR